MPGDFKTHEMEMQLVRWLNAIIELDRDRLDKSVKVCIQFPWVMGIQSGMGAQDSNLWVLYKMENHFPAVLGNQAFFFIWYLRQFKR